jgi:hypothetical protein
MEEFMEVSDEKTDGPKDGIDLPNAGKCFSGGA